MGGWHENQEGRRLEASLGGAVLAHPEPPARTGVLPFWKMVWTAATGCLQEAGRQASVVGGGQGGEGEGGELRVF